MNRVILIGNLGADPELRTSPGGAHVLKLRMATTETFVDRQDKKQEKTSWHNVTIFGKRAEALAKYLTKGERVAITGRIEYSESEKDGVKRFFTDIVADDLEFCGGGKREDKPARRPAADDEVKGDDFAF